MAMGRAEIEEGHGQFVVSYFYGKLEHGGIWGVFETRELAESLVRLLDACSALSSEDVDDPYQPGWFKGCRIPQCFRFAEG